MTNDKTWICKDGRELKLSEMEDDHIIHAWRFFSKKKKRLLQQLEQGLRSRHVAKQLIEIEQRLGFLVPEMLKRGMHE